MQAHQRGDGSYFIYEIPAFLSPAECAEIMRTAVHAGLSESEIYGTSTDEVDRKSRHSYTAWLPAATSALVRKVNRLTAEITGYPEENQEDLQVVHYPEGGFFNPHYDCCDGGPQECSRMDALGGPRHITVIIYLNDDYEGGETAFPKLGITVRPETGKAAIFWSTDKNSILVPQSFHGGNPVTNGEKWICNKWIHLRPYR
ncbi:putative prolyl 4-hydroxylase [Tetrabaena socialis]|uniref:Putative prolyl 4-hydroxylase n=1 Tax=Tetrabaena socialis TaxID=47790 RepID=A0A2J7ZJ30_9CHLO|nr:putative prolyl 4-hydroxylase [Tetrabaena socialis]PNH00314.1 putative prolyl 4-hydroxylase [Tetrabaena socialis]|eukprot:PNH00268.1 putative prolyl 4-hydroxylase [Tetrabaena socialis]